MVIGRSELENALEISLEECLSEENISKSDLIDFKRRFDSLINKLIESAPNDNYEYDGDL